MKKLIITFFALCVVYIGIVTIQNQLSNGYHISYIVNTNNQKFEIEETYKHEKNNQANHWFQIKVNNIIFPFQVQIDSKKQKIVKSVYYYEDQDYSCMYPVGEVPLNIDVLCYHDDIIYPYHSMEQVSDNLEKFVNSLEQYDTTRFLDPRSIVKTQYGISLYNNLVENHMIGMENYKGLVVLNRDQQLTDKKLFTNDIYQKKVHLFYRQYYIVADYNQSYEFHEFLVINMQTMKETKIISNKAISFDSYIQGVVGDSIYLLDRINKCQYEINLSSKSVNKIGDTELGVQVYSNQKWITMTMYDSLKEDIYFKDTVLPYKISTDLYDGYQQVGHYYYLYKKDNDRYIIYRIHDQLPNVRYYIATIDDINQTGYIGDYFYWKDQDSLYYYHDSVGTRIVVRNPEFEFNVDLQFGINTK